MAPEHIASYQVATAWRVENSNNQPGANAARRPIWVRVRKSGRRQLYPVYPEQPTFRQAHDFVAKAKTPPTGQPYLDARSSGHFQRFTRCRLFPESGPQFDRAEMSVKGHKRTHASQQFSAQLFVNGSDTICSSVFGVTATCPTNSARRSVALRRTRRSQTAQSQVTMQADRRSARTRSPAERISPADRGRSISRRRHREYPGPQCRN
jgi:hypothetical protein